MLGAKLLEGGLRVLNGFVSLGQLPLKAVFLVNNSQEFCVGSQAVLIPSVSELSSPLPMAAPFSKKETSKYGQDGQEQRTEDFVHAGRP